MLSIFEYLTTLLKIILHRIYRKRVPPCCRPGRAKLASPNGGAYGVRDNVVTLDNLAVPKIPDCDHIGNDVYQGGPERRLADD